MQICEVCLGAASLLGKGYAAFFRRIHGRKLHAKAGDPYTNLLYDKLSTEGPGDCSSPAGISLGFWTGPLHAKINPVPPMTPWGQEQFSAHKGVKQVYVAESNDPLKSCDPLGFPRNMLDEIRGIALAQMPGKMLVLNEYNKIWREIPVDGPLRFRRMWAGGPPTRPIPTGTDTRWGIGMEITASSWTRWEATRGAGWMRWVIPTASTCECRNATRASIITIWK